MKIKIIIILILLAKLSLAQNPHYYFDRFEHSIIEPITVYSVDLVTGQKEVLFSEDDKIYGVPLVSPDQSRIFFLQQTKLYVYNAETQTIDTLLGHSNIESLNSISFVPSTNEIYLSYIKRDAKVIDVENHEMEVTYLSLDKNTYALIDTIFFYSNYNTVLSRSGDKVYELKKRTDGIYFKSVDTRTFERDSLVIEGFDNLENIYQPYFIDANNGYVFISYINLAVTESHFIVCDPEEGKSIFDGKNIKTIRIPPFGEALTNNGDMIFQDKDNFYVLSHETGKLRKRLKFHFNEPTTDPHALRISQKAKLLILGDTLYYLPKNPDDLEYSQLLTYEVGSGNINDDQTDMELLDMLLEDPNELYQNGWILNEPTKDKYNTLLINAKTYLTQGDTTSTRSELEQVLAECSKDSLTNITIDAYALLTFNAKELFDRLPEEQTYPYLKVNFKDSEGNFILDGSLQYYDAGWQDATDNGDGTFNVETEKTTVSLRMHYAGASQTVSNVEAQNNSYTFTTVNATVQLLDSKNEVLDGGTVQYYASGWKDFGDATNGEVAKELLPKEYSFRMNYGGANQDKKQDIGANPVVVFQTVAAKVQLQDSQGNLLSGGTVQYYASGWKDFGTAANGEVTKELLPKEYSFRMSYGGANQDQKQDIGTNSVVVFQTVNAKVQLQDSQGNLLPGGTVQYYASGWKEFGDVANGEVTKELLPREYSFRMSYANISNDKSQDIGTNSTVIFTTVQTTVKVKDANNQSIDGAEVQYYGSGWQTIGTTVNGEVTKELLPKEITFKAIYNSKQSQKQQDISGNSLVEITIE